MIEVILTIMVIVAIVLFILSMSTYDDGDSITSTVFITLFVLLNIVIYVVTVVNYHQFYSGLYTFMYGLDLIINLIIIAVAIVIFVLGAVFERPYMYMAVVVITSHIYSPTALIGTGILALIVFYALAEPDYSTSSNDVEDENSYDSSDESYDYSSLYGNYSSYNSSSSNDSSDDNIPSVLNRRDSSGNVVEYFLKDSSGCFTGSHGTVIMKDAIGDGYRKLDGSVYYHKDRYGDYVGSDGTHYNHDRYGDLVCDNGDYITKD